MKPKMLMVMGAGISVGLLMGSPALSGSMEEDRIRGAEWDPERAVTQNLPAPRYRTPSSGEDRYRPSYDQRFRQDQHRSGGDGFRYQSDPAYRMQDRYASRDGQGRPAHNLKGTLLRIKGDMYVVNTRDGYRNRLHVDDRTLLDAGIERGDRVIAKVRPDGHAIALLKDRGRRGEHYVYPGGTENRRYDRGTADRMQEHRFNPDRYRP